MMPNTGKMAVHANSHYVSTFEHLWQDSDEFFLSTETFQSWKPENCNQ